MNPLAFKAHPILLYLTEWITQPLAPEPHQALLTAAILILGSFPYAAGIAYFTQKGESFKIAPLPALLLALPASFLYTPLLLTLLQDVVHHAFLIEDRWFLLFSILVAHQILTALYAFGIKNPESHCPIGLDSGLGLSSLLLLIAMGLSLGILGIEAVHPLF